MNPPDQTTAVDPKKSTKMVKIRTQKEIRLGTEIIPPGKIVEVTESEAEEFCKVIPTHYNYRGEREGDDVTWHKVQRAVKV